jgi:nucleoside-diphosphate-sugar epimerase
VASWYGREITLQPGTLQQGSPPRRLPDTAKMEALGYRPRFHFTEALDRTLTWYRDNG